MTNKFAQALRKSEREDGEEAAADTIAHSAPRRQARPSRTGVKHVGGYFEPEVSRQLRQIALDEDSSVQELLAEALDMLFHSRHKPTIAQRTERVQT